ncbi:LOW QUALITY PROTEIN: facilitated trehalose transporter Tret1-like [Penaeus monodon]|uniref:LOW QUALITY PROTEIN: facilitated trehalose transporter Tret1-like n=1 Tax=Penaeus monodon TaxID=6687 RepID=UPI0018A739B0|nr:LOW QUALITY PROTEIN: facilitated trehalose transporter Tret1-like [Penaeus monodon]
MPASVSEKVESEKDRRKRLAKQICIVILASLGHLAIGSNITFPSVAVSDLERYNTTITGAQVTLTDTEKDMMGSLVSLGSLPGAWLAGILMAVIGRRYSMILSGVVCFASWVGVALLPTPTTLLVARGIAGVASGSMSVAGNTYAVEMADVEIRGAMALIPTVALMLGQVLTVVIGYVARYYVVALVCSAIPLAYVVAMALLPESPAFLAVKGREKRARKTLIRLRGEHADVDAEIEGFRTMNGGAEGGSWWRGLLQADVARALGAVCGLFLVQAFTGYFVFTVNASRFFKEAGSSVDENLAAIIVMVVQFTVTIFASLLMDKIGRRKSLFVSLASMIPFLAVMALYVGITGDGEESGRRGSRPAFHPLAWARQGLTGADEYLVGDEWARAGDDAPGPYGWVPLVAMMLFLVGSCFGVNPVPYILANEYFPTGIRSQASSVCISVSTVVNFVALQVYTPMQDGLTQAGLYAFYAVVCAIGIPYTYFFKGNKRKADRIENRGPFVGYREWMVLF